MAINFAGNLYDDSGAAIQGATVQLIGSDGVQEGSSVDTSVGTGAWSFSDFYSYVCRMIGQNGRRGALMITMDIK